MAFAFLTFFFAFFQNPKKLYIFALAVAVAFQMTIDQLRARRRRTAPTKNLYTICTRPHYQRFTTIMMMMTTTKMMMPVRVLRM